MAIKHLALTPGGRGYFTVREAREAAQNSRTIEEKLQRLKARRQDPSEQSKPIDQNYTLVGEPRGELLGSVADVEEAVKVILGNGGEVHSDRLQDTDYRTPKANFGKLTKALLKDCGIAAVSSGLLINRTTGVYVKAKGSGNWVLMKVGQARPQ